MFFCFGLFFLKKKTYAYKLPNLFVCSNIQNLNILVQYWSVGGPLVVNEVEAFKNQNISIFMSCSQHPLFCLFAPKCLNHSTKSNKKKKKRPDSLMTTSAVEYFQVLDIVSWYELV